jgi:tetratricopeptide (TPR) repeat protein
MHVLLGPLNRRAHRATVDLPGFDVKLFDRQDADVAFDPGREPLEALWSRLPSGWQPDRLIWWSPEYSVLPEGIERCPVPSIAVLGDWNLGVWATAPLLEAFDWVVTDRGGVQTFGPQLDVPVDVWPAFSFDPAIHRRDAGVPRDIDVLFVGNLNSQIQDERAPWLSRIARLGGRHRVLVTSGVYGEAYGDLLRRARIVWNRSIRGELNMRAYEAPAAGALLLMEAENLEVRDVFADGVSCALYDAATLERQVEDYLGHPERLARVAEAGWRRVQSETYVDHFARLVATAGPLTVGRRPFSALPAWRRDYWLGLHAASAADADRLDAATRHLARAFTGAPDHAPVASALGAVAAMAAVTGAGDRERSLEQAAQLLAVAVRLSPDDAISRSGLAWVAAARGRGDLARGEWLAARAHLESGQPFPLDRLPVPFGFDRFRNEWERAAIFPDLEARAAAFRPILAGRIAAGLAGLEEPGDAAVEWWAESVAAAPGVEQNVRQLARALEAAGHADVAAEGYARALERDPFDSEARLAAASLALRAGDLARFDALCTETRQLVSAAPHLAGWLDALDRLAGAALACR